jgi:hypothetical protein
MASGGKDNRMVFDIRGRRKNVVKVVYAVLAVLMGLSLFLVVGGFNLGELFSGNGSGSAAKPFEEQAEQIEVKLKKEPEDPDLLVGLTRARVNAANQLYGVKSTGETEVTEGVVDQLQLASDSWSRYLKATENQPAVGLAQLMAPNFLVIANYARTVAEAQLDVEAAAEAAKFVADKRPSLNSLTTQAFYTAILGENEKAQKLADEAKKYATSKEQREAVDSGLESYEKIGKKFQALVKKSEKVEKQTSGGKAQLESSPGLIPPSLGGAGIE